MKMINNLSSFFGTILLKSFSDRRLVTRYIVSGIIGISVNLLVLYLLTDIAGLWYILSALLAYVIGYIVTFTLQKYWTFRDMAYNRIFRQATLYLVIAIAALLFDVLVLYILVDIVGLWYLGSQIFVLIFIAGASFLLNKNITFKNNSEENEPKPEA